MSGEGRYLFIVPDRLILFSNDLLSIQVQKKSTKWCMSFQYLVVSILSLGSSTPHKSYCTYLPLESMASWHVTHFGHSWARIATKKRTQNYLATLYPVSQDFGHSWARFALSRDTEENTKLFGNSVPETTQIHRCQPSVLTFQHCRHNLKHDLK